MRPSDQEIVFENVLACSSFYELDELEELLMSRTILDIYMVKQCPDSVMLWLLQLCELLNKSPHSTVLKTGTCMTIRYKCH